MKKYKLLLDLVNAFGVSGKEAEVRNIIAKAIRPYVDKVYADKMGNLICQKKGKSPKIMVAAHMDEIGLIVKNIEKDGKLKISTIGGIEHVTILNEKVQIKTRKKNVTGIVTTTHISSDDILYDLPKLDEMFVDTGLSKQELTKAMVHIGSFITFIPNAEIMGNNKIITGKALDDRIGCFVLIELAKKLKNSKNEVFFVFTVQEEIGLYGAKTSTYTVDPDWAIAVDVTTCDDRATHFSKALGFGPTLTIKDADMITNPCIDDWLLEIAKKQKIPLQPEVTEVGTTDAMRIAISKGGVPSSVIGVSVRNLHTATGMAHLDDIDNAIKILHHLLKNPQPVCLT